MSSSSGATVERSPTRILRDKGIDPSIKCTSTLVASYNSEEDPQGRKALRKWIEAYFDEFSHLRTGSISRNAIAEFVNLAEIEVRDPVDAELVRRVYTTLSEVVMTKEGCSVYFVLGLEHVLSITSNKILQEDTESLVALANRLITMTDPLKVPLTRATIEKCVSCLHALERVLMLLHDLEKDSLEQHNLKFFEHKVKVHLSKIISCQHYYPFAYQAFLIKENIKTLLEKDTKSLLINAGRRAFYAFCGGLHFFQAVRELAVMKLDFSSMESGIGKFREAFRDVGWDTMPNIQEIVLAASEAVEHDEFEIFQHCYDKYRQVSWLEGLKRSKQRMTRYAIVAHLCLFCTEENSESIQAPALDLLVRLATSEEGKSWRDDEDIHKTVIEALIEIGKHNQHYVENIIHAFMTINSLRTKKHEKIIEECLNGMRIEEMIKSKDQSQEDSTSCSLFQTTRQRIGLRNTSLTYNQNRQTLEDHYKTDSFSKVSLFADECDQRHIQTFDFNLEEYEEVVVFRDSVGQSSQDSYNQRENNLQRTMKVKKPIRFQELFKARGTPTHGFHEDAQHILVIGNPGTGKTSLSKRLCYEWANGSWGSEFERVYCLPIRRLSDTLIGSCGDFSSIVLQLIYHVNGTHDSNKGLYGEVKDRMFDASTLLILDGYDESGEAARDLVSSSFQLGCCLLILSRPHSLQSIRLRVNVEIECLEFSEQQLESFVHRELGFDNGNDLLSLFSQNLSIKDTCRVAVNAQIITRLWTSSYKEELTKSSCANLASFYYMTSTYIWQRFTSKGENFDANKTFDSLEPIAFESFQRGQVEIPEHLVLKHARESMRVFCASGFLLFVKEGSVFQFAHLTFHEYFAGRHLAKLLMSINDEERQEAVNFIIEHRYIETSRVMLSFMTQQFCLKKDIRKTLEAFKDLMQVLNSDPMPTISLQHLLLRMRTLDAFLPCGYDETKIHTNDDVMLIVNDSMNALKHWFGYELDRNGRGKEFLIEKNKLRTPIVDELERMPNLFNNFPDLLKPILLSETVKIEYRDDCRRDIARIGKLNPQYVRQCIVPLLDEDDWTKKKQHIYLIHLCALSGPLCTKGTLGHLKGLCQEQDFETRRQATRPLFAFLDLFPKREDVRQLVSGALTDQRRRVRHALVMEIRYTIVTPKTEEETFVWDLLVKAIKDDDADVREEALEACVANYQIFVRSVDEVIKLVRKFVFSTCNNDRYEAVEAIANLIQKAPEKIEELLVLLKALCKDPGEHIRKRGVILLLNVAKSSCLGREDLLKKASDLFKDGYPNVQVELLPFLFSFDKKEIWGIDAVNELIATCKDLDEEVRKKANSCRAASALLSKHTIEEINDKFNDQDEKVQLEIVKQFDVRETESKKSTDAIATMAVHCLQYDQHYESSKRLLEKLSKTELFPNFVLKELAQARGEWLYEMLRSQPLSHLLEYYWNTKDSKMILFIAEKLLLSPVIFEKKGEREMEVTFREKGAKVKQTAPVKVVQELLSLCKGFLKRYYGLDFH